MLGSSKRKQRKNEETQAPSFRPVIPEPGSQTWPFKLGDEVEDPFNPQLRGILVGRTYHVSGCDTFTIDLLTDPKNLSAQLGNRTEQGWPGNRLKLIKEHADRHVAWEVPPKGEGIPALGDRVKDYITGVEGKATHIATVLSQSVASLHIQPPAKSDGEVPEGHWTDLHTVEVLEPYKKPEAAPRVSGKGATRHGRSTRTAA